MRYIEDRRIWDEEGTGQMSKFIVQTAAANMPASCKFGRYRRVAVLEVHEGIDRVSMISSRARGVVRVVETWERCSVGKMVRSTYVRALAEAERMAATLNGRA